MPVRDESGEVCVQAEYILIYDKEEINRFGDPYDAIAACDRNPGSYLEYEVVWLFAADGTTGSVKQRLPESKNTGERKRFYPVAA